MRKRLLALTALVTALVLAGGVAVAGAGGFDFGRFVEEALRSKSMRLYGLNGPLPRSSTRSITAEEANADPRRLATLARSLRARVVTHGVGPGVLDMSALWPSDRNPRWLITCNESGTSDAGLVRINIATGVVETILTGTDSCDPAHRTPWGTILFAEEAGGGPSGGRIYELIDPLNTTNVTLDRTTGTFSGGTGADNFAIRTAIGRLSYEGFAIYPNGVVYFGDEQRPLNGVIGGAYFKFIPATLRDPGAGPVTELEDSPLAAGSVFGLRLGRRSGATDYGQGTQNGLGSWVPIPQTADTDLRAQAQALRLTGFYRPEDIDIDRRALADDRVEFCANNTGNEPDDQYFGEVVCITDGTLTSSAANTAVPELQTLVLGSPAINMPDNIAYQAHRGNWIIHEDGETVTDLLGPHNDDLWSCLPDGNDEDLMGDGCVRIATLNDLEAEWTGGIFDASGKHFYVSIQHNVTGTGTILDITGWK